MYNDGRMDVPTRDRSRSGKLFARARCEQTTLARRLFAKDAWEERELLLCYVVVDLHLDLIQIADAGDWGGPLIPGAITRKLNHAIFQQVSARVETVNVQVQRLRKIRPIKGSYKNASTRLHGYLFEYRIWVNMLESGRLLVNARNAINIETERKIANIAPWWLFFSSFFLYSRAYNKFCLYYRREHKDALTWPVSTVKFAREKTCPDKVIQKD